jgi:WD40 repeat protein
MSAQIDLERTLEAWFGAEASPAPPSESLARILESTRVIRPRPALIAGFGGRWVGAASGTGPSGGIPSLRRALVVTLLTLAVLALVGLVALAGSRLLPVVRPTQLPHTYSNQFTALADLSRPMDAPVVVPLVDGRVLVIGRGGDGGDPTTTAELYDPATGASDPLGQLATPRGFVDSAVRLKDGRVLILADGVALAFDPSTLRVAPVGPMVTPRRAAAAVLRDGRVLIAGGITPGGGVKTGLLSAELFDPDTLTFSATGSMGTTAGALATLPDGRVFVAPDSAGDTAQIYDPSTGAFSAAGTLSTTFGVSSAVSLPDGRVVVFGAAGIKARNYAEVWDSTSRTFSAAVAPPAQVRSATLRDDGRILLTGGRDPGWAGIFDPSTLVTSPIEAPTAVWPSVARLPDGRLILVGGLRDGGSYVSPDGAVQFAPAVSTVEVFQ